MYKLKYTKEFEKHLKGLSSAKQKAVASKLKLLVQNPFLIIKRSYRQSDSSFDGKAEWSECIPKN